MSVDPTKAQKQQKRSTAGSNNKRKRKKKKKSPHPQAKQQQQLQVQASKQKTSKRKKVKRKKKQKSDKPGQQGPQADKTKGSSSSSEKKSKQERKYAHLEHLPVQDQLKIIVKGWFICHRHNSEGSKSFAASIDLELAHQRRAEIATSDYWNLECFGHQSALKASGSKWHARKNIREDRTFDAFGLMPPLLYTRHAQIRLKERGGQGNTIPRFVAGTNRTVVATVVPKTEGKRRYQLFVKQHKKYQLRKAVRKKEKAEEAARRASIRARNDRRRSKADTRRRKKRKEFAELKERVLGNIATPMPTIGLYVSKKAQKTVSIEVGGKRSRKKVGVERSRKKTKQGSLGVPTKASGTKSSNVTRSSYGPPIVKTEKTKQKPSNSKRKRMLALIEAKLFDSPGYHARIANQSQDKGTGVTLEQL